MGNVVETATSPSKFMDNVLGIDPPPAPTPKKKKKAPPPLMPQASSEEVRRAKRRSLMRMQGRRGRASTIMSEERETLG